MKKVALSLLLISLFTGMAYGFKDGGFCDASDRGRIMNLFRSNMLSMSQGVDHTNTFGTIVFGQIVGTDRIKWACAIGFTHQTVIADEARAYFDAHKGNCISDSIVWTTFVGDSRGNLGVIPSETR